MLVICHGCKSRIKVPDRAAGKRIKCPKCQTTIQVPRGEPTEQMAAANPDELPPETPPPDEVAPPEPDVDADKVGVTDRPSSSGRRPPPVPSKESAATDDDHIVDDDRPSRRVPVDEDDDRPSRRRRRERESDDDIDAVVKKKRRKKGSASGLAITSMIMGIVGVAVAVPSCCCCTLLDFVSLICGIVAVICGHMSMKAAGSEGFAMTGLICGYITIAFSVVGLILFTLSLVGHGLNLGFNPPPRFR